MPRIKPGQKPINKPAKVSKELHPFELDNVLYDAEQMELELAPKMVKFAQEFVKGGLTIKECARRAGYSGRSLTQRGTQLVQHSGVMKLISAYKRADMLQNGMPLSWKRQELKKIVESATAPESAKISAIRLLAEIDGDLRPDLGQGANITVQLNLGSASGQIIEHEPVESPSRVVGGAARGIPHEKL